MLDWLIIQCSLFRTSEGLVPISVTVADKGYDSHILIREHLCAFCTIIPARYEHVPIFRTHGKYGSVEIINKKVKISHPMDVVGYASE
ncbi:MAG TPA: hypothetical protein VI278_02885 [Nitrososphaeraceae archaeon]